MLKLAKKPIDRCGPRPPPNIRYRPAPLSIPIVYYPFNLHIIVPLTHVRR